jgi:hypothetical protein
MNSQCAYVFILRKIPLNKPRPGVEIFKLSVCVFGDYPPIYGVNTGPAKGYIAVARSLDGH